MRWKWLAALGVASSLLAACGGGGTQPSVPVSGMRTTQSVVARPQHTIHGMLSAREKRRSPAQAQPSVLLLQYHNGYIQRYPKVYLTFWGFTDPSSDPDNEIPYMENFVYGIKGTSWLRTVTQYYDTTTGKRRAPCIATWCGNSGSLLAGVWYDNTNPLPPNPISGDAEANEANAARTYFNDWNTDSIEVIVYPTGHWPDGFVAVGGPDCAWHGASWYWNGTSWVAYPYASMPYQPDGNCGANTVNPGPGGILDGVGIVFGHEIAETITDPIYWGTSGWYDTNSQEIGDRCSWNGHEYNLSTSAGTFAVQQLFSNAKRGCVNGS